MGFVRPGAGGGAARLRRGGALHGLCLRHRERGPHCQGRAGRGRILCRCLFGARAALEQASLLYGFRIAETLVQSDLARPRICVVFSEDLVASGVDYATFVALPESGMAVESAGGRGAAGRVLDRDGALLRAYTVADGRWWLSPAPDWVDPVCVRMLLAQEDRRFARRRGVEPRALARAALTYRLTIDGALQQELDSLARATVEGQDAALQGAILVADHAWGEFLVSAAFAPDPGAPAVSFPPDGAEVELVGAGQKVRVSGGTATFTWLVDGVPVIVGIADREAMLPLPGAVCVTLSVIDAAGRSDRVQVRLR